MRNFAWTFKSLFIFSLLFLSQNILAQTTTQSFASYDDLQKKIVTLIDDAKGRVWLATRSLQDHAILDALLSAYNRKAEVRLLLGSPELPGSKFAVFHDAHLRAESTTAVLIDQHLIWVNVLLTGSVSMSPLSLQYLESPDKLQSFVRYFSKRSLQIATLPSDPQKEWEQLPSVFDTRKRKENQSTEKIRTLPRDTKWKNKTGSF